MGKSTLVNALAPDAGARVGEVSRSLRAGKHTTSSAALYRIPALGDDGWIVDSPGLKTFGLAHVASSALEHAFVELRPYLGHCRFRDCRHDHEPGCAVTAAVDAGRVEGFRVDLLHTLKRESARP
jgi:ribosome biogenesis GTPase